MVLHVFPLRVNVLLIIVLSAQDIKVVRPSDFKNSKVVLIRQDFTLDRSRLFYIRCELDTSTTLKTEFIEYGAKIIPIVFVIIKLWTKLLKP